LEIVKNCMHDAFSNGMKVVLDVIVNWCYVVSDAVLCYIVVVGLMTIKFRFRMLRISLCYILMQMIQRVPLALLSQTADNSIKIGRT